MMVLIIDARMMILGGGVLHLEAAEAGEKGAEKTFASQRKHKTDYAVDT
jgi:hypothetical protein